MSEMAPIPTEFCALQRKSLSAINRHNQHLFDHLGGAQQDRGRYCKTERLGGLEVDGHLEFGRHLDGKLRRPAEANIDDTFLRCLDAATAQGRCVVAATGRSYAPTEFAKMPEGNGFKSKALGMAMQRLLSAGRIRVETFGPPEA